MAINEVFQNPTVKQVIFQIRYPNLFFIEKHIGGFQQKIMKQYPESAELIKTQFLVAASGQKSAGDTADEAKVDSTAKIWQFKSEEGVTVSVTRDAVSVDSTHHKTYKNESSEKFRDEIKFVIGTLFSVIEIPILTRIGLRYIDECPIDQKDNAHFQTWYNTTFPLDRFGIDTALELDTKSVVQRGHYFLRFIESLRTDNNGQSNLILDFDAYANTIEPTNYLEVADELHAIISDEYESFIREPVYAYMRGE